MISPPETHIQNAFAGGRTDIIKAATEAVENAVREALEERRWRLIEDGAPLDGTSVLLAIAGSELGGIPTLGTGRLCVEGPHYFGWWGVGSNSVAITRPTHWMPLPSPPSPNPETDNG
jgi:hypothetical protein